MNQWTVPSTSPFLTTGHFVSTFENFPITLIHEFLEVYHVPIPELLFHSQPISQFTGPAEALP